MRNLLFVLLATTLTSPCMLAADGQILINQATVMASGGFPYTITQSGSYKLSGNLTVTNANTDAIHVNADNVTIDLNGFSIVGPVICRGTPVTCNSNGTGTGVDAPSSTGVTVTNGSIRGMGAGVFLCCEGNTVDKVHAHYNGNIGIQVIGTVTGSTAVGNGAGAPGGGGIAGFGTISGDTATSNVGFGFNVGGVVIGNYASGNTSIGIEARGAMLSGNAVNGNQTGVYAYCSGPSLNTLIVNNTVSGNVANLFLAFGGGCVVTDNVVN